MSRSAGCANPPSKQAKTVVDEMITMSKNQRSRALQPARTITCQFELYRFAWQEIGVIQRADLEDQKMALRRGARRGGSSHDRENRFVNYRWRDR